MEVVTRIALCISLESGNFWNAYVHTMSVRLTSLKVAVSSQFVGPAIFLSEMTSQQNIVILNDVTEENS
jgi:hypothetical protein